LIYQPICIVTAESRYSPFVRLPQRRSSILKYRYDPLTRLNAGAPGVDGVSFAQIKEQGPKRGWRACARFINGAFPLLQMRGLSLEV